MLIFTLGAAAPQPSPPAATPSCPAQRVRGPSTLLTLLLAANYDCTEEIARALTPLADDWLARRLLNLTAADYHSLTRRNALRTLGRFAEQPPGSPARETLQRAAPALYRRLLELLTRDPSDDVRAEAIWILDTFFFPAHNAQTALSATALTSAGGATLRTRAAYAVTRLIAVRAGLLTEADMRFLLDALHSDEAGVRARAADAIQRLRDEQIDTAARARVTLALESAWIAAAGRAPANALPIAPPALHTGRFIFGIPETAPGPFAARAALARALDRFGGARYTALRTEFEAIYLPQQLERPGLRLRAARPAADLVAIAQRLDELHTAFRQLAGASAPVAGDQNATLTLKLFANRSIFREYMLAFTGFGADVDGIYVEADATLYTYERDAAETANTVAETIAHEYGHYLTGRYLFAGSWNDPGYHNEPRGWLDEGLAEYLAGMDAAAGGRRAALNRLCARAAPPDLQRLLAQRDGYDQHGVFAYDESWALVTYLAEERPDGLRAILAAFRDGTYRQKDVATLAGAPSLAALQIDWHTAIDRWCDP